MLFPVEFVVVCNLLFCLIRTTIAIRHKRLITIVWLLISYHSFFLMILAFEGPFTRDKGFSGEVAWIDNDIIYQVSVYVLIFNILFAIGEVLTFSLVQNKKRLVWRLHANHIEVKRMKIIFGAFLLLGGIWYGLKMQGLGYRDYVEYSGSNWPIVFLWAGSPFITLSVLQRKYIVALLMIIPFVIFTFYLNIRSFLLLSLIPAFVVIFYQEIAGKKIKINFQKVATLLVLTSVLVVISATIMFQKVGRVDLPDSGLVYGMHIVFDAEAREQEWLGFNSLQIYALYLVNPFVKLAEITGVSEYPKIIDTPVYMARMTDGVPLENEVYFHYPTLWYSDAYVSFAWAGLLLAIIWGCVVSLFELIMIRNTIIFALILPYYTWHNYMLVRGSIAGAAVPFSYAFYFTMFVYFLVRQSVSQKRQNGRATIQDVNTIVTTK